MREQFEFKTYLFSGIGLLGQKSQKRISISDPAGFWDYLKISLGPIFYALSGSEQRICISVILFSGKLIFNISYINP